MKNLNLLIIWAKRSFFALALAGIAGLMLPSCEKEPIEQHDEEIFYYGDNNNPKWNVNVFNEYIADKHVRKIYIIPGESFSHFNTDNISARRRELQEVMDYSKKMYGRGNFEFAPGVCTYGDSLDLVAMGFTINQQNQR